MTTSTLALGVLVASCGGGGSSSPAVTFAPGAVIVNAVPSLRFDATQYGPVAAGNITFGYANQDTVRHTLIIAKNGVKVANFKLVIGKKGSTDTASVTLESGSYQLLCDVPGHANMKATFVVE
ncbi:MAG: hypothetical protein D4R44_04680 [Actinobacteria bacterium]|jgi:hypothetical protein|nr:MAG: hypothetical protein D4R44_04680 [Actinomycetota bacterium]